MTYIISFHITKDKGTLILPFEYEGKKEIEFTFTHDQESVVTKLVEAMWDYNERNSKKKVSTIKDLLFVLTNGATKVKNEKLAKIKIKYESDYHNAFAALLDTGKFGVLSDDSIYMVPFKVPVPTKLLARILYYYNDTLKYAKSSLEYEKGRKGLLSCVNFWILALCNPNPEARNDLFNFIEELGLVLTPDGYFLTLKSVGYHDDNLEDYDGELDAETSWKEVIIAEWERIKRQKKSPKNYHFCTFTITNSDMRGHFIKEIEKDTPKGYRTIDFEVLGVLDDLYINKDKVRTPYFTDHYTRRMKFTVGDVVEMDRNLCNSDPGQGCSSGLHVGTAQYVLNSASSIRNFNKSKSAALAVAVNPADVVAVPRYAKGKIRTCRYYIVRVLSSTEEIKKFSDVELKEFDMEIYGKEKERLEEMINTIGINKYRKEEKDTKSTKTDKNKVKEIFNIETFQKKNATPQVKRLIASAEAVVKEQYASTGLSLPEIEALIATRLKK